MRYATARFNQHQRDLAYRIYVTDGIRIISESAAKQCGGPFMGKRFYDMIKPKKVDNRSGEEIAADVFRRMGVDVV